MSKYFVTWDLGSNEEVGIVEVDATHITEALDVAWEKEGHRTFNWLDFQIQVRYVTKVGE